MTEKAKIYSFDDLMKRRWENYEHEFEELREKIDVTLGEMRDYLATLIQEKVSARRENDMERIAEIDDEILYVREQMAKAVAPLFELRKKIDENKRKYLENKKARESFS